MERKQIRRQYIFQLVLILLVIGVVNFISSMWYFRLDLTEDKRHSLSETTKEVLHDIDDALYVKVYLESDDLPADYLKLQRKVREMLNHFRRITPAVEYEFINLFDEKDDETRNEIYKQLWDKGLNPEKLREKKQESYSEQMIFPGAIVTYKGTEYPVNFIEEDAEGKRHNKIQKSLSRLEQKFVQAMLKLTQPESKKIAFIEGHGELDQFQTADVMYSLSEFYEIERLKIDGTLGALNDYEAVIVAKPTEYVNERDKFILDQYIMHGGKVLWLVEWMGMSMDSLSNKASSMALIRDINMDDLLFNYGVRINPDLLQDLNCLQIPITVNTQSGKPQFEPRPWYFFPRIKEHYNHRITKNVSPVRTMFPSSLDTVKADGDVKKTFLLKSSQYSRTLGVPVRVSLDMVSRPPDPALFNEGSQDIAVLLEGSFESNFKNRIPPQFVKNKEIDFKQSSETTRQIVISDGDIIRNYVKVRGERKEPFLLGADRYYKSQFTPGNKEFIMNSINYLCGDEELIDLRMRQIKMRLLDKGKVYNNGMFWVVFNTAVPIIIIIMAGFIVLFVRKYKYLKN